MSSVTTKRATDAHATPAASLLVPALALTALWACGPAPEDFDDAPFSVATQGAALVSGPAGTISAQYADSPAGEGIANLVDGDPSSKFLTFHPAVWVQWKGAAAAAVTQYSLTSANDAPGRDPKSWTLQASKDGATWKTLDSRSGQTFSARYQKKAYALTNKTAYLYYRLTVTANAGDGLTQLAEWGLTASSGAAPVVTLFQDCSYGGAEVSLAEGTYTLAQLQAKGVKNDDLSSLKVQSGYAVTLYENDGFGGASVVKTGDVPCLTVNGFNDRVSSVKVAKATTPGDWSNFTYPTITFTDQATALEGSRIFHQAVPDAAQVMREQCLAVSKSLYSDDDDTRQPFTTLNLILLDDPNTVAAKWGSGTEVSIGIGAQYLASFFHANQDRTDLVLQEVRGILTHEGTHGYQYGPQNCGAYDGSSVFWAFIEGEADAVRAEVTGWTPARTPVRGGSWMSGYGTTGFFLSWCKQHKKASFLVDLNHAARDMPTFSWDGAFQRILGQNVQAVWDEYRASLPQ